MLIRYRHWTPIWLYIVFINIALLIRIRKLLTNLSLMLILLVSMATYIDIWFWKLVVKSFTYEFLVVCLKCFKFSSRLKFWLIQLCYSSLWKALSRNFSSKMAMWLFLGVDWSSFAALGPLVLLVASYYSDDDYGPANICYCLRLRLVDLWCF